MAGPSTTSATALLRVIIGMIDSRDALDASQDGRGIPHLVANKGKGDVHVTITLGFVAEELAEHLVPIMHDHPGDIPSAATAFTEQRPQHTVTVRIGDS